MGVGPTAAPPAGPPVIKYGESASVQGDARLAAATLIAARSHILSAILALGYAFTAGEPVAFAGGPKNLKVLPKDTSKKQIKRVMKSYAKSLGVQCDHCHDMDNMAKDTKQKKVARGMMRMVQSINKKHMRGSDTKVSCMTCHRGEKKPSK